MLVSFILFVMFCFFVFLRASDAKHVESSRIMEKWKGGSLEETTPEIHEVLYKHLKLLKGENSLSALAINEDGKHEVITAEVVSSNTVVIRVKGKVVTETFCNKQWKNLDTMMFSFARKAAKKNNWLTMCSVGNMA